MVTGFTLITLLSCSFFQAIIGNQCDFPLPGLPFGSGPGQWNFIDFDKWKTLPGSFCAGKRQTPINIKIENVQVPTWQTSVVQFETTDISIVRRPYALQTSGKSSDLYATDSVSGNRGLYRSNNIHYHVPSEHWIDGKEFPMELHFVQFLDDSSSCNKFSNKVSVYAVLLEIDETVVIPFFDQWIAGNNRQKISSFNVHDAILRLLPSKVTAYQYDGSFAIPPCNEFLQYIVIQETIKISTKQIELLQTYSSDESNFKDRHNARPIQPLNGRTVWKTSIQFNEVNQYTSDGGDAPTTVSTPHKQITTPPPVQSSQSYDLTSGY